MSGPSGMAIDPALLFNQQARAAAAAATAAHHQPEAGGSNSLVKQEQLDDDADNDNVQENKDDQRLSYENGQKHDMEDGPMQGGGEMSGGGGSSGQKSINGHSGTHNLNGGQQALYTKHEDDEDVPLDLRDDAELAAFLAKLEDYDPILPDPVTRFYLEKAGFQSSDDRVTRMLGLAAQKFVGDIAKDAYAFARTRITTGPGRMPGPNAGLHGSAKSKDRTRTVLTMEDLASAMNDYGIDASRAPYYR